MGTFRFLQLSDIHLDAPLGSSALGLPRVKQEERRAEILGLMRRACELAREREVNAILLPGDLFHTPLPRTNLLADVIQLFSSLTPTPVFIAPGNHDPCSLSSCYHPSYVKERGLSPWPANVFIFRDPKFTSFEVPGSPRVWVTGMNHPIGDEVDERWLTSNVPKPDGDLSILLFHGSLEGEHPGAVPWTMPFSKEELLRQESTYAGLGHFHSYREVRDEDGKVRAAYSGCPAGLGLDETGKKFVLLGVITDGRISLQKISLDPRTIHRVELRVGPDDALPDIEKSTVASLDRNGVSQADIVYLDLKGEVAPEIAPEGLGDELRRLLSPRTYHSAVNVGNLRLAHDLSLYLEGGEFARSVEGEFVRRMMDVIASRTSPEEREAAEDALRLGLDALVHRQVLPPVVRNMH